jgi:hypothetical protein
MKYLVDGILKKNDIELFSIDDPPPPYPPFSSDDVFWKRPPLLTLPPKSYTVFTPLEI